MSGDTSTFIPCWCIEVHYEMLDVGRYFAKLEVTMINNGEKVANALVICQMFDGF